MSEPPGEPESEWVVTVRVPLPCLRSHRFCPVGSWKEQGPERAHMRALLHKRRAHTKATLTYKLARHVELQALRVDGEGVGASVHAVGWAPEGTRTGAFCRCGPAPVQHDRWGWMHLVALHPQPQRLERACGCHTSRAIAPVGWWATGSSS